MRVPSANLSWIEVEGNAWSTTKPIDGAGALCKLLTTVGSTGGTTSLLLPNVLPWPWNELGLFFGTYIQKKNIWQWLERPNSWKNVKKIRATKFLEELVESNEVKRDADNAQGTLALFSWG